MSGLATPLPTATLDQWLDYLESLHHKPIDLGLDRIRQVLARLDLAMSYVKITVGGTNGKGSTCAMLEAMLLAAGYKVGLYTSPHLVDFNERLRVHGAPASDAAIISQFQRIEAARGEITLSYFEFATLAALLLFEAEGVDAGIFEVGLGGRLDAINAIDPDCAVVTSVDIDHADYLGSTREAIALEKAHIFRPHRPAICADPVPPATLVEYAESIGADLWRFGRDFNYAGDRQQWSYGGRNQRRSGLAYPALRGANQLLNASAAMAALESLRDRLAVPQQAVRLGLAQAALPGRFQILPGQPMVILDVAHNPHAAAALAHNLEQLPPAGRTLAVFGMLSDKDVDGVLARMAGQIDVWHCASLPGARGCSGAALAERVLAAASAAPAALEPLPSPAAVLREAPGVRAARPTPRLRTLPIVTSHENPVQAFDAARGEAGGNDRILVFGSFATVGPVLAALAARH